jgi:hypothetical protein
MAAADVLDFASHFLDQSEVNCCANCLRLEDYLKVALMELKSAQQIIMILHEEKENSYKLKNQVNLPNLTHKCSEDKWRSEQKPIKVCHTSEKIGMVKQN